MDDFKKIQQPLTDATQKISDVTNAAADKLEKAPDVVEQFAGKSIERVEQTLDSFTQKSDAIFNTLDKFFKKF